MCAVTCFDRTGKPAWGPTTFPAATACAASPCATGPGAVTGLAYNTYYSCKVVAVSANGKGPPSMDNTGAYTLLVTYLDGYASTFVPPYVYVVSSGGYGVTTVDSAGTATPLPGSGFLIKADDIAAYNGELYLTYSGAGVIQKIPITGGTATTWVTCSEPSGIAIDAAGNVYYTDEGTRGYGGLYKIAAGTTTISLLAGSSDGVGTAQAIALDPITNVLYFVFGANSNDPPLTLGSYNLNTGIFAVVGAPDGFVFTTGLGFLGPTLYAAHVQLTPAPSTEVSTVDVSTGFTTPTSPLVHGLDVVRAWGGTNYALDFCFDNPAYYIVAF